MTPMWPLNLPARRFLKLPGATSVAWGVFDANWYRTAYPGDTTHLAAAPAGEVLTFYLDTGQALGHSPNLLFDETWHRRAYPAMAKLVEAGQFPSAFDAYCRGGCLDRSPHWLFDEADYRRRYPDLTDTILAEAGLVNGYDHYLWRGNAERRIAHPFFDPAVYLAQLTPAEAEAAAMDGTFQHCLRRLDQRQPEVRTSLYFDPAWYVERYPAVAEAIAGGTWRWALEHYLCNETPTRFDPNPWFSEAYYRAHALELAAMLENRRFRNGYAHFLRHGIAEGRSPADAINLTWYAEQQTVRHDLGAALAPDPFTHWLAMGQPKGLRSAPASQEPVTEAQATALVRGRAQNLSALLGRMPLRFATTSVPALSVVVVLDSRFELTLMTLSSLRAAYSGEIELILLDSGSNNGTETVIRCVSGMVHLRLDTDIPYLRGRNVGLTVATADTVLYLNNDVELAPGAIAAALRRLEADPRVGAVGGMVIRAHNVLQDAGNIVWCDGSIQGYMHDSSPLAPEANFTRDVDFCSGGFLMSRRSLLNDLQGLDEAFAPACYDDADLCVRMAQAGYRVVYDPVVAIYHLGLGDAGTSRMATENFARCREVFIRKHASYLARRPARDGKTELLARSVHRAQQRVLFMEDTVPLRMIGSGFVRSNDLVKVMASMGYGVTVYPLNGCGFEPSAVYADMPDTVEVMHTGSIARLQSFLMQRQDHYHAIWVARTHNLEGLLPMLKRAAGSPGTSPLLVLDTEAIASLRDAQQAALKGQAFDVDAAIRDEFHGMAACDKIVAVTEAEAARLRDLGAGDVAVIGHLRPLCPTPRPFSERAGMLFVGAIHRMDSPNYDSLCWFIDEVMPLIEHELGWQTRLTVVGYTGAGVTLDRFRDHPRVTLREAVPDLEPLYDAHRIFVAPTRFAAGTPYKVHEAASFGLPVVATDLLRQHLAWDDQRELLTAGSNDPQGFARQVIALHREEGLWQRLRDAALDRLRRDNSRENYAAAIAGVLGPPAIAE